MGRAKRDVRRGAWAETDVARVVSVLRRSGPQDLRALVDDPALAPWPPQRVEDAVVSAWSRNLISVDPGDLLVAL
jgi:hypothetical protein